MSAPLQNLMLRASAGSGKTYRLTSRFIQLMAGGRPPESIVALTFTRKAAGEFFDEIGSKLAGASADPSKAAVLAEEIGKPKFGSDDFRQLLRDFLRAMPKLTLGTFDSFFHRVVSLFPFEFGFPGGFEPLDDYQTDLACGDTVARILEHHPDEMRHAIEQATCGNAESGLLWKVRDGASKNHSILLCGPDPDLWGNAEKIWPDAGELPEPLSLGERQDHVDALMDAAAADDYFEPPNREKGVILLRKLGEAILRLEPGKILPKEFDRVTGNIRNALPQLKFDDPCTVALSGLRWSPATAACGPLIGFIRHIDGCILAALLQKAAGTRELLALFEDHYQVAVREAGQGDFADVQNLLSGEVSLYHGSPAFHLAAGVHADSDYRNAAAGDGVTGLAVGSRLGLWPAHWLLDEFQDTSYPQWQVLEPLIEETLDCPETDSSLFYVGDVKQAIYGWRGGDSRLFLDVFTTLNERRPGSIRNEPMDKSWRSGPSLMKTLNRVFGSASPLETLFGEESEAVTRWRAAWQDHSTEHDEREDYFRLAHAQTVDDRHAAVLEVLEELQPHRRSMSGAILCRTNKGAEALAEFLRVSDSEVPVILDAEIKAGADNPLATLFLSALTLVQHPADQKAAGHMQMSPIHKLVWPEGIPQRTEENPFPLPPGSSPRIRQLAVETYDCGFSGALDVFLEWIEQDAGITLDEFSAGRASELQRACAAFDETGDRSVFQFRQFLENYTGREPSPKGVVQIMTVHRSKGLGFDFVILPDLEGNAMDVSRVTDLWAKQDRFRHNEWVIGRPNTSVSKSDPVLGNEEARRKDEECFEALCQLYVAMTRAKFGTYVITSVPKPGAKSQRGLLNETLVLPFVKEEPPSQDGEAESPPEPEPVETVYENGHANWYNQEADFALQSSDSSSEGENLGTPIGDVPTRRFPARESVSPSGVVSRKATAWQIFNANSWKSAGHGTQVHQLLEAIEFVDPDSTPDLSSLESQWSAYLATLEPDAATKARDEVSAALESPTVRQCLSRPEPPSGGSIDLWRERRFEVVLDDQWVSGVFDRVVIHRDAEGRPVQATITDFKTNAVRQSKEIADAAEHYRPQLELYRAVLHEMTGVPEEAIDCELLFTVPAEVQHL